MAYAALSSLAQTTHRILNHDQFLISHDEKQQITLLREKVIFLREALDKFPMQASSLEARIRASANEAEDIIEHFMYDQIWNHHYSTTNNPHHLHHDLEKAMEEINSISREAADFTAEDSAALGDDDSRTVRTSSSKQLGPAAGGVTVGLDEDLLKIADSLTGGSSSRQIIPLVGMGGIGKTTLAKTAYHHPLIMVSFTVRAWVTVSQDYNSQNIFSDLLDCFEEGGIERYRQSNECMEEKVHKILKGRKYLIVLDDVWSRKAWDDVSNSFPDDGNGSRIVITTRLADVASYAVDSSSHLHQMRFMDQDQSWDLLKKKVFPSKDCPPDLEEIGVEIARRCGGLPLAIVLVAGMLSAVSETRFSWKQVAEKVGSGGELEKIISLSYTNLPHHLRSCFLYMGAFPEDYEIRASKLSKLWTAEGFVEVEEEAVEYLEDLVKRSLVLVKKRKSDGKIKSCGLHDMVREICRRRAEEENIQHRVSISQPDLILLARTYGSTLRSVICSRLISASSLDALRVFKLLRVLDVVDVNQYPLPAQVFDLFHLRYLAFACPNEIPAAICRLRNLQTLIVCPRNRFWRFKEDVIYLPLEIWTLPLLTRLVSFNSLLPDPQGEASPLNRLLELSVGRRFVCTKKITEMIPNVRKLGITYFGDKLRQDYQLQNLVFLHHLEKLKLVVEGGYFIPCKIHPVFPESLRKLTLSGCRFPWEFMDTVGSLPNLQVLKLRNDACRGRKWETKEDQFPSLEFLEIDKCNLKKWVTQGSHFPRLKCLVVFHCSRLSNIPNDIGDIPTLELINVDYANNSLVLCVKRIQDEQRGHGNYALQVHCTHRPNWKTLMVVLEVAAMTAVNISIIGCTIV